MPTILICFVSWELILGFEFVNVLLALAEIIGLLGFQFGAFPDWCKLNFLVRFIVIEIFLGFCHFLNFTLNNCYLFVAVSIM